MLAPLALISELQTELVTREGEPDIRLLVITLGRQVVEDEIWLLDEGSLELSPFSGLPVELFLLLNFFSCFTCFPLLGDLS